MNWMSRPRRRRVMHSSGPFGLTNVQQNSSPSTRQVPRTSRAISTPVNRPPEWNAYVKWNPSASSCPVSVELILLEGTGRQSEAAAHSPELQINDRSTGASTAAIRRRARRGAAKLPCGSCREGARDWRWINVHSQFESDDSLSGAALGRKRLRGAGSLLFSPGKSSSTTLQFAKATTRREGLQKPGGHHQCLRCRTNWLSTS